jgi:hypothetical protein
MSVENGFFTLMYMHFVKRVLKNFPHFSTGRASLVIPSLPLCSGTLIYLGLKLPTPQAHFPFPCNPTHLLGGAGIHTLSVTADAGCQPVMVMVPYFTTKRVMFYPSEPSFHRRESREHHAIHSSIAPCAKLGPGIHSSVITQILREMSISRLLHIVRRVLSF